MKKDGILLEIDGINREDLFSVFSQIIEKLTDRSEAACPLEQIKNKTFVEGVFCGMTTIISSEYFPVMLREKRLNETLLLLINSICSAHGISATPIYYDAKTTTH